MPNSVMFDTMNLRLVSIATQSSFIPEAWVVTFVVLSERALREIEVASRGCIKTF